MTLSERIAAADGPSRELFHEAYAASNYGRLFDLPASIGFQETYARFSKFERMLDAEAWTSAAEMLVPEGYRWAIGSYGVAEIRHSVDFRKYAGMTAATPALALAAASLKARGL